MHRLIMGITDKKLIVDHIKHIPYDNRKSELRIFDIQKNISNRSLSINNTSGVTGVCWKRNMNKWVSKISYKNKQIYLGSYDDFIEAVKVRKEAEEIYFGIYSYDNSMKQK
jgi:hypothetical protein